MKTPLLVGLPDLHLRAAYWALRYCGCDFKYRWFSFRVGFHASENDEPLPLLRADTRQLVGSWEIAKWASEQSKVSLGFERSVTDSWLEKIDAFATEALSLCVRESPLGSSRGFGVPLKLVGRLAANLASLRPQAGAMVRLLDEASRAVLRDPEGYLCESFSIVDIGVASHLDWIYPTTVVKLPRTWRQPVFPHTSDYYAQYPGLFRWRDRIYEEHWPSLEFGGF